MSYDVPTKKYPIAADVDALALFFAQRQSDSGVTNGGIVATGSPAVPDLTGNNMSLAYFKAMVDALLCRAAYVAQDEQNCSGAGNTSSTTFVDVTNMPTYAFTAQVAGTYLVHLDISGIFQSVGLNGLALRIVNSTNSANGNSASWNWFPTAINVRSSRFSARTPLAMQAGSNSLKVQWRVFNGADTANVDTSVVRAFTISG